MESHFLHGPCQLCFGFSSFTAAKRPPVPQGMALLMFQRTVHSCVRCERDLSYWMPVGSNSREGWLTEPTFSLLTGLVCALAYLTVRSSYPCSVCTNIWQQYSLFFGMHLYRKGLKTGGEILKTQNFTLPFWNKKKICREISGTRSSNNCVYNI